MKRDMDYVREILLKVEASEDGLASEDLWPDDPNEKALTKLDEYLHLLIDDARLLRGTPVGEIEDWGWVDLKLTWAGHEYVEAVRDPEIWAKTKAGAEKIGGFGIDVMKALAIGLIKKKAKDLTDVDLDL